jgi:hypothetical protein
MTLPAWRLLPLRLRGADGRELRRWVTPEELNVAPGLLGMPLARPTWRLLAMGLDLAAIGIVSSLSNFWLFAAFCLGLAERARARRRGSSPVRMVIAWALVAWMAYVGVQELVETLREGGDGKPTLADDEDADEATEAAMAALLAASAALPASAVVPHAALDAAVRHAAPGAASAAATPAPVDAAASAAATIEALNARVHALERQLHKERAAAEEAVRSQNWRERLRRLGLDFGIGYGWALVYFTLLPTWWKGQTLGKRVLGLRVREITGKPMTPVQNFKRFGGYLAGMATGGLGLVQLLWDANRQGLQDKAAHTVVVDERAPCRPTAPAAAPPEDIVSPS